MSRKLLHIYTHHHLVEMPAGRRCRSRCPEVAGKQPSELPGPHPDRLIAQVNSPLGHEVLDIPKAQRKPEI